MWVLLALLSAFGSATTTIGLKQTVTHGGAVVSMIAFRFVAGVLLALLAFGSGAATALTPAYWQLAAIVMIPEVVGLVCVTQALRSGDLSLVQPIMGLLPLFVMLGGVVFLHEHPAPAAAGGVLLVTAGIYGIGLEKGRSLLEPFRALARERASRYAIAGAIAWSATTLLHKVGIAEVGALPWAATLALGSSFALVFVFPFLRRPNPWPADRKWGAFVVLTGVAYVVQLVGLNLALQRAQAGYVVSLSILSTLLATLFGIFVLGERTAMRNRIIGSLLVTAGAVLVALYS